MGRSVDLHLPDEQSRKPEGKISLNSRGWLTTCTLAHLSNFKQTFSSDLFQFEIAALLIRSKLQSDVFWVSLWTIKAKLHSVLKHRFIIMLQ